MTKIVEKGSHTLSYSQRSAAIGSTRAARRAGRRQAASPKLILADEPTGNLHSEQGAEIMQLFQKLNSEGTTIIQVTHSETNAGYGRRVVKMRDGWIVND